VFGRNEGRLALHRVLLDPARFGRSAQIWGRDERLSTAPTPSRVPRLCVGRELSSCPHRPGAGALAAVVELLRCGFAAAQASNSLPGGVCGAPRSITSRARASTCHPRRVPVGSKRGLLWWPRTLLPALPVRRAGVLRVRRGPGDDRAQFMIEGGRSRPWRWICLLQGGHVFGVGTVMARNRPLGMPAVRLVPLQHVLGERTWCRPRSRCGVVVERTDCQL